MKLHPKENVWILPTKHIILLKRRPLFVKMDLWRDFNLILGHTNGRGLVLGLLQNITLIVSLRERQKNDNVTVFMMAKSLMNFHWHDMICVPSELRLGLFSTKLMFMRSFDEVGCVNDRLLGWKNNVSLTKISNSENVMSSRQQMSMKNWPRMMICVKKDEWRDLLSMKKRQNEHGHVQEQEQKIMLTVRRWLR